MITYSVYQVIQKIFVWCTCFVKYYTFKFYMANHPYTPQLTTAQQLWITLDDAFYIQFCLLPCCFKLLVVLLKEYEL